MNIRMASFKDILAQLKQAQTMMRRYWNRLSQIFPNISPMLPDAYSARLVDPDGVPISISVSTPPGSGLLHAEVLVSSDDGEIAKKLQEKKYLDEVISFYGKESALETVAEVAEFIRSIIVIAGGAVDTDAAEAAKVSESEH
jgi:hypothetical protein